ncbi:hypothetical protein [Streptomyces sp. NPDC046805]|uniref:hypothetical protein n=1 Tax=Streptomyces sp. NPDC046805 TaxID=3155134 RepID=UPI0033C5C48E
MAETVTAQPKKAPRKPDPMARILADVKAEAKKITEFDVSPVPASRAQVHDGRSAAWGRQYAKDSSFDALLLSLAFEALAGLNDVEVRYSLTQLGAVVLDRIAQIDEAGK